jgi:hypothetical protein
MLVCQKQWWKTGADSRVKVNKSMADMPTRGLERVDTVASNTAAVEAAIQQYHHVSIKTTAADLSISVGTVHSIIQTCDTRRAVNRCHTYTVQSKNSLESDCPHSTCSNIMIKEMPSHHCSL